MANFSIANSSVNLSNALAQAITTTYKSQVIVCGSTNATYNLGPFGAPTVGRRVKLYDMLLGTDGTPADNVMQFDVARVSYISSVAAPTCTGSSIAGNFSLDPADTNGFQALAVVNSTSETGNTFLAEPWYVGINQRASYRWIAAPGSEIVMAANLQATTAFPGNGLAIRALSPAYTGLIGLTGFFNEQ